MKDKSPANLLVEHLFSNYVHKLNTPSLIAKLRDKFKRDGVVPLEKFGGTHLRQMVYRESYYLLDHHARTRCLKINPTNIPGRCYSNVGHHEIATKGTIIPHSFQSAPLIEFISSIAADPGETPGPYRPKDMMIGCMTKTGDSHRWHWDDDSFPLVWLIEVSPDWQEARGAVGDGVASTMDARGDSKLVGVEYLYSDTAYLIRGSTLVHRISHLAACARRVILCYSYTTASEFDDVISREAATSLGPAHTHPFQEIDRKGLA